MTRRPHVSDHALLRYLERVVGIDVPSHRRAMERKVSDAVERGACGLISGGYRYAIRDLTVTTVTTAKRPLRDPYMPRQDGDE